MLKIDHHFLKKFFEKATNSPRQRINHNFHESYNDLVQRFLNVLELGTYIQPHKHIKEEKFEVVIILKGRALVAEYNDDGDIVDHIILDSKKGEYAVELTSKTWHSMIALKEDTVLYEIKQGPFVEEDEKLFASWAPKEGDEEVKNYIEGILKRLNIVL